MPFNFPNPALEQTVTNPETGITYTWLADPGKWIIEVDGEKLNENQNIVWEGDTPPSDIDDVYSFWYSTDTLELYYYYCDPTGVCAWVPTSVPIQVLENLNTTVAQQATTIEEQIARIDALEAAVFSTP